MKRINTLTFIFLLLQCGDFCCTTMWINHNYTEIPFLCAFLLTHHTLLGHYRVPDWASCVIQQLLTSYPFYIWSCIYVDASFSIHFTLSSLTVFTSLISISVSPFIPANRFIFTIYIDSTSDHIRSVSQSCLTLCDPMNRGMPGLHVHHQLPEFTQTHVHRVSDAIQPTHPLSSPSPPAPNPSQHQSLFQWVSSSHEVAKVLEFQL